MTPRRRFWHVAGAGAAFQAGSAAVDSATVMSALVFQLTGSPVAVGAVSTILRLGWLLPQLFVGYLAGRSGASMPFYVLGAFGRTAAIAALAGILWAGAGAGGSSAALGAACQPVQKRAADVDAKLPVAARIPAGSPHALQPFR